MRLLYTMYMANEDWEKVTINIHARMNGMARNIATPETLCKIDTIAVTGNLIFDKSKKIGCDIFGPWNVYKNKFSQL